MASNKPTMNPQGEPAKRRMDFGSRLAMGLSLGLIFGLMMDNIAMGMSGGLLLATLTNAFAEKQRGEEHANVALAISIAALVLLVLIWLLWR